MTKESHRPGLPDLLPVLLTAWGPSGTDSDHKSHILPHTQEAGDPYYIGDVYEKSRFTPSRLSTKPSAYAPLVLFVVTDGSHQGDNADCPQATSTIYAASRISLTRMATHCIFG